MGCRIVAVSSSKGGIYNPKGLNHTALLKYYKENGSFEQFPHAETVTNSSLLELPSDILIPAAMANQITEENADRIKARIIVEGANGPTTPEADHILDERKILIVPDILANAGGVIVSYFEWVQDVQCYFWSENEADSKLKNIMFRSHEEIYDFAQKKELIYALLP